MRKVFMVLVALAVIFSLSCISTMAEEARKESTGVRQTQRSIEKDHDPDEHIEREYKVIELPVGSYNRMVAELDRQREEIHSLREEVRSLREEIVQLLADLLERQWEEIHNLREMQQHQYNFMQEMLSRENEIRLRQVMGERNREWEPEREEQNIEMELRHMQEQVERNPRDPELRLKLGHIYREVDNIDAAFGQFKAAIEIAPDFEPAYGALEDLRAQFPDVSRRPNEKPLEDSAGTVISANKEEIKLQVFEGDVITFKVPFIQNEEGKWVLVEDFAHFAGSLEPGMKVKILWQEMEDRRIIRRVERIEDEE
ncbi:hypothetical protein ACFL6S_25730 [Candidatus Poribacteria bacterium]